MGTSVKKPEQEIVKCWDRESNIKLIQNIKTYYEQNLHNKLERHGAILYAMEIIVGLFSGRDPYFVAKDCLGISIKLDDMLIETRLNGFDNVRLPEFQCADVILELRPVHQIHLLWLFRYLGNEEPDVNIEVYCDIQTQGCVVKLTIKEKSQYQKEDYENVFKAIQDVD